MKRSLKKSIWAYFILMAGLMSCEERDLTFDVSNAFVAFREPSGSFLENEPETILIELYYASTSPGNVAVSIGFDATGIENPAVEGADFNVLSSKTVSFDSHIVQAVEIETIDNELKDKDKSVYITLTGDGGTPIGMGGGANATYLFTLKDDEHPLSKWVGTYDVYADSYGDVIKGNPEGAWDENWVVTTKLVENDTTKLEVVGIAFGELPVIAKVDKDAMTITFKAGSDTGTGYGYESTLIWKGDYENVVEEDVVGTIRVDGTIEVDQMAMVVVTEDGGLGLWDAFHTHWTPATKKSAFILHRW
jgi:hypothetical protein